MTATRSTLYGIFNFLVAKMRVLLILDNSTVPGCGAVPFFCRWT